ncbi:MAG: hypothetical protein ACK52S_05810 [Pirellula sp.]
MGERTKSLNITRLRETVITSNDCGESPGQRFLRDVHALGTSMPSGRPCPGDVHSFGISMPWGSSWGLRMFRSNDYNAAVRIDG